ncbi:MAG TPA: TIGR01777 family oxidoreductase [Gemmatimonadaceae bacterium]|nr:TIGR01777 family oxidoreductase [Gemmatimonadaceae bacterium]
MKVVLAGGTGQVGTILARAFHSAGNDVVVLSRQSTVAPWRVVQWDARTLGAWSTELDGADSVINLAGRSVDCRYTTTNREAILSSRVESTRVIGAAIAQSARPPRAWLQMSTATIYAHRLDAPNDEASGIIGGSEPDAPDTWRFSIEVARAWEAAANESSTPNTRKVLLRSAMVMSHDRGGIFDTLLRLVRLGLGGTAASGRQFISWIHHADFVRAVTWLLERENFNGVVNLAAPQPLPNAAFMRALRKAWGTRIGLPATAWMLEIGALAMRTETELVLKSRRVVPGRLVDGGFEFRFPEWPTAARELCQAWRESSVELDRG